MNNNGIRVLLIEDNPGDARLIREMLTDAKSVPFILEWRGRLSEGLQKLTQDGADVVLLDLELPDSQGLDTYANLHSQFSGVPIVVLSGLPDESLAVKAVSDGAQDYLVKGQIDGKLLARSIRYAIERKKSEDELRDANTKLRNLYINLQSAREEERTNIAREIHDELGQIMTAIKMDIAWLKVKYCDNKEISEKASSTLNLIDATIKSIKKICTELRPDILEHLGLGAAIQWQAEEFQNRTGIMCEVTVQEGTVVGSDRSIALFRIFQEALTNVLRHANATQVIANLKAGNGKVILEISDNGKGITEEEISKPDSFGLLGMQERVYPWKGSVNISGSTDRGTRIEVVLPVEETRSL
ncbi:MAG: response regulator [Nitrospirae bacterium]|nr:response regulator [Nitrospirota bacterium]